MSTTINPIPVAQAKLGGIGRTKLYDLFSQGELVRVNIGRRAFVTQASIDSYLSRLANAAISAA